MHHKKLKLAFLASTVMLTLGVTSSLASEKGSTLFEEKCAACHVKQRPAYEEMKNLIAPPIMGVMTHVKDAKANKEEAVTFIVDYIFDPSHAKAVCMKQSIQRFGLMPSQKGSLTKEEATVIAEYLYKNYGY
ncbi:c-type cytochrome [Sulfuricurvum sp.]|uniref:c-type cytochrome n=1 Tax=Sulfuricurvum sp. TaxID=2025608 RepID=UPI002D48386D|nr:c-type cytochrome [Sulfuricurvum sp.]HZF70896.1 c-type cytochrome [Sulfuricurvum sp.]